MSVLLNELDTVRHKHSRHLSKLALLLSVEQPLVHGVGELLQDGAEHPVVQGQVAVGVTEHEPASQGRVRAGQLALDRVLGHDQNRFATQLSVPGERRRLEKVCQVIVQKKLEKSNKSLTLLF